MVAWSRQEVGQESSLRAPGLLRLLEGRCMRVSWAPKVVILLDNVDWMALQNESKVSAVQGIPAWDAHS